MILGEKLAFPSHFLGKKRDLLKRSTLKRGRLYTGICFSFFLFVREAFFYLFGILKFRENYTFLRGEMVCDFHHFRLLCLYERHLDMCKVLL